MASAVPPPVKTGLHRTITGSQMNLNELDSIINGANCRDQEETSSIASSSHAGSRSNIVQIVPGTKNVKLALRAALAEAQGYDDPDEPPVQALEDLSLEPDESGYDMTSPNTPRGSVELKHNTVADVPSEPLEGAGAARRTYSESSAPPEGAGGFSCSEFVPPVVEEPKPPAQPRYESVAPGLRRTITGSSMRLDELQDLVEKAGEAEYPATPSSTGGGRTPRSHSAWSLASGSRTGSIVQVQPGVKDIRAALAAALAEGQSASGSQSPTGAGMAERQSLGGGLGSGMSTPLGSQSTHNPFSVVSATGPSMHRPRSIRRLMSEKSFTMDTVYSGMVLDSDVPSEPLEGVGVVADRRYQEPRHGPQVVPEAPKDFPRVVNGVPTASAGDEDASSIPPSPQLRKSGVHRTISGSQMDLAELAAIMEKATVPKHERTSFDSRSSTGASTATHRTVKGSGLSKSRNASQVFGEELQDEPKSTFGRNAASLSREEIQALIDGAAVPRREPDSPRDSLGSFCVANEA